jgi:hypothetical protein
MSNKNTSIVHTGAAQDPLPLGAPGGTFPVFLASGGTIAVQVSAVPAVFFGKGFTSENNAYGHDAYHKKD